MTDVQALEARLAALEARVQVLDDHEAITQLLASYGPSVDSGAAEATAALWTEDGVFAVVSSDPAQGDFTMNGRADIVGMVNGEGHQGLITNGCGHVLTAPKIRVDGDEATAWNYAFNIRWDDAADRFWIARLSANRWECARGADGWRVVHRTNINLDGAEAARALLRTSTTG
ncbi:MAG: nuclear transport factor 2 family protein [Acidimicrobiia bacterium]